MSGVQYALMKKYGLSPEELKQVMDHGIRSPLETYNRGAWAKLTDKQAQDLLNTLYDGI
jgi:crotonobetainyl-CoA:carnitine CoA-transferase CaiB-like acyl-CoA transferase